MPTPSIDPLSLLHSLLLRVSLLLMWTIFAVFHLGLALTGFFLIWITGETPATLSAAFLNTIQSTAVSVLGLLGMSLVGILTLYIQLWRMAYRALVTPFIFNDINRHMNG